jgi:UDP-N-acetyl-D-glucosamine dehydrogenase
VRFHDPFVPEVHFDDAHTLSGGEPLFNVPLTQEELQSADCVMIIADHSGVDYNFVTANTKLIVDTRNALTPELREQSQARVIRL